MASNKERFLLIIFFFIGILTRLPFVEKMQSHWDGPDYSIAIVRYSLENHTPSAPGYPIYIGLGKIAYMFTHDPHTAILMVSVFLSGVGAVVFYIVGKLLFNSIVGIVASLIFLSAPTIYFFGITANPYGALTTTSAVLAGVVYLIVFKKRNYGILLGVIFSFAIGFRPQDVLFLSPLFAFGFIFLKSREKYKAIISFFITFLIWFIPTIISVGGIASYIKYIQPFFTNDARAQITFDRIKDIWFILLRGFYLTFGIAGIFLVFYLKKLWDLIQHKHELNSNKKLSILFFFLWIGPSLFFNAFVRSDHAAHQMAYLSGLIFLTSYAIFATTMRRIVVLPVVMILVIGFNLYTFFRNRDPENKKPYVSQSYHYSELRKNDIRLSSITSFVSNHYSNAKTIILVDPEIFRPVTYYLKKYKIYSFSSLDTDVFPFIDFVHLGYNWDYRFKKDKSHVLVIPKNVDYVVCITNNKEYDILADDAKKFRLNGNAFLYTFNAKQNNRYGLSLHTIKQIDEKQTHNL